MFSGALLEKAGWGSQNVCRAVAAVFRGDKGQGLWSQRPKSMALDEGAADVGLCQPRPRRGFAPGPVRRTASHFRARPQKPDPVVLQSLRRLQRSEESHSPAIPQGARCRANRAGVSDHLPPSAQTRRGCGVRGQVPKSAPATGFPLSSLCLLLCPSPTPISLIPPSAQVGPQRRGDPLGSGGVAEHWR